jgi:hypothetical protein
VVKGERGRTKFSDKSRNKKAEKFINTTNKLLFYLALQPSAGYGLLFHEIS